MTKLFTKEKQTILVLAPHTDDGEIGCGATMAKFVDDGHRVVYLAFSAAEKSVPAGMPPDTLRKEVRNATRIIGILAEDCIVLDFEVREFPLQRQRILDSMLHYCNLLNPAVVFLPSGRDTHQDHKTVAEEAFRAFKRTTMLGYEIPWNNLSFVTSCFVEVEKSHLERKIEALGEYHSQRGRAYVSGDYVRSLAATRGMQIKRDYAEVFEVVRVVID